ncbi:MAG: hypothetical protein A3C80_02030 [Candidatus Ryanbacteria bacterium RIFCSPHIGHO2_02_FULL_45_43]|uniref:Uncharacterized protein n=1 Tax=Candidatus Ryanbacteria bacterium RIFCSPHIGHO2_01_45_13 TaxID=1802112 RepID=A0A1G2FY81_9BACT|nr:MAG: hypothetical protein A2718_02860 [Candidatus Ryanbacteria bacterium RIFCSPHIGHO2_01_FULL_44_130]OGZ43019.1 MAG: hypothetical protein A2W41_02805 [Candidatus Ryanbacteria bacterium RIFCSPHIGHO2_01_45_13]OGZ48724.1 MAG: hypothetical protein A3C80_02030 [Candidatus Ryanbacteria bacterium RIFCSPHIGHO2_02_FULL_45_43]OGZ50664.1 MAG: hypothetical protein A3E55_03510 [Candidatus Ryanbacteria bacterium RIFCSPHIGHO2_12_FULL_44_20]OGZ51970.1 MAG: hypothetical protein A3A17_00885 [Candidatus Ryanba
MTDKKRAGKKWRGSRGRNFLPASEIPPPAHQRGTGSAQVSLFGFVYQIWQDNFKSLRAF